jgi:uncharacterized lipoprotein YajG
MYKIALIIIVLLTQACAFTDAKLSVQHNNAANIVGPISEIEKLAFDSPVLEDRRLDKARIGWKKNGYGQHTADITTVQPVTEIVQNALTDAIGDNGHSVSKDSSIKVTGSVDRFWFETDMNFWTVEFIGDVQCTLNFLDAATNKTIYTSVYKGTNKKKTGGGLEKTWTEVMGAAVDNLIENIVFDDELSEALQNFKKP